MNFSILGDRGSIRTNCGIACTKRSRSSCWPLRRCGKHSHDLEGGYRSANVPGVWLGTAWLGQAVTLTARVAVVAPGIRTPTGIAPLYTSSGSPAARLYNTAQ